MRKGAFYVLEECLAGVLLLLGREAPVSEYIASWNDPECLYSMHVCMYFSWCRYYGSNSNLRTTERFDPKRDTKEPDDVVLRRTKGETLAEYHSIRWGHWSSSDSSSSSSGSSWELSTPSNTANNNVEGLTKWNGKSRLVGTLIANANDRLGGSSFSL